MGGGDLREKRTVVIDRSRLKSIIQLALIGGRDREPVIFSFDGKLLSAISFRGIGVPPSKEEDLFKLVSGGTDQVSLSLKVIGSYGVSGRAPIPGLFSLSHLNVLRLLRFLEDSLGESVNLSWRNEGNGSGFLVIEDSYDYSYFALPIRVISVGPPPFLWGYPSRDSVEFLVPFSTLSLIAKSSEGEFYEDVYVVLDKPSFSLWFVKMGPLYHHVVSHSLEGYFDNHRRERISRLIGEGTDMIVGQFLPSRFFHSVWETISSEFPNNVIIEFWRDENSDEDDDLSWEEDRKISTAKSLVELYGNYTKVKFTSVSFGDWISHYREVARVVEIVRHLQSTPFLLIELPSKCVDLTESILYGPDGFEVNFVPSVSSMGCGEYTIKHKRLSSDDVHFSLKGSVLRKALDDIGVLPYRWKRVGYGDPPNKSVTIFVSKTDEIIGSKAVAVVLPKQGYYHISKDFAIIPCNDLKVVDFLVRPS